MNASVVSLGLVLGACVAEPVRVPDEPIRSIVDHHAFPLVINTQIDVLFVIDNSPAMAAAQTKLVADYRSMIDHMSSTSLGLPDVHIGVTTTDPRDQGQLRRDAFLVDSPRFAWQRDRNYAGPLADAFLDLATVGTSGTSDSKPLDAMRQALDPAINRGFVRDDAYLAVVFLTASDDHGSANIDDVVRAVKSLKTDPFKVVVSATVGACAANGVSAAESPRLAAFLEQFPNRSAHTTLCDDDLTPLVAMTTQLLKATLGAPCIESKLREPPDCKAWMVDFYSDAQELLPECSSTTADRCWILEPDRGACISPDDLVLRLRPRSFPFSTTLMFDCVVESE